MPSLAALLTNYLPGRFFGSSAPQIRRVDNGVSVAVPQELRPLGLKDFLSLEIPPREILLAPILPERSLSMLYAPTWTAISRFRPHSTITSNAKAAPDREPRMSAYPPFSLLELWLILMWPKSPP